MRTLDINSEKLIPELLHALFRPDDRVRIATGDPGNSRQHRRDECIQELIQYRQAYNIWFSVSAFDDSQRYGGANCLSTRALCLDIEWQSTVHPKARFATEQDTLAHTLTLPLAPSSIWRTGHGLQAMYLLDEPIDLKAVHGSGTWFDEYKRVAGKLARLARADTAGGPEHLWRVPLTLNQKPGTPPVWGTLLTWYPDRVYTWDQITRVCNAYDVPEPKPEAPDLDWEGTTCDYTELPEDLRELIEDTYPVGERSSAMHGLIGRLVRQGYSDSVIHDAISRGPSFTEKYGARLSKEIDRSLGAFHRVCAYSPGDAIIELPDQSADLPVDECAPLDPAVASMLDRYAAVHNMDVSDRVRTTNQVCNHVLADNDRAVVTTPCGSGKTTWALAHIAASTAGRYLYVVETLDKLYEAAQVLCDLNPDLGVGRVHGFDQKRCHDLCRVEHEWRECAPAPTGGESGRSTGAVCPRCPARNACVYYTRNEQLDERVLVLTHNGLVRLIENRAPQLRDATVIVDESLDAFVDETFTFDELRLARPFCDQAGISLGQLFPTTLLSSGLVDMGLPVEGQSFAASNYVYLDRQQTATVCATADGLRRALRSTTWNAFKHGAAGYERATAVVTRLISYLRPSAQKDATLALTETSTDEGPAVVLKKNRFSLDSELGTRRFVILSASAPLRTGGYPRGIPVYSCPDIDQGGHLVTLNIVRGNPTRSRMARHVPEVMRMVRDITHPGRHQHIMLATDKGAPDADMLKQQLTEYASHEGNPAVNIVHLERGSLRGTNEAGHCTLACLATMALFTRLESYALTTALHLERTVPRHRLFFDDGNLRMSHGRLPVPAMQAIYTLGALDELYQAVWRTCVRNGQCAEAVVALPDPEWVTLLWRTVMPGLRCAQCREVTDIPLGEPEANRLDLSIDGLVHLLGVEPGREFLKSDVARLLGYTGKEGWKGTKRRILKLLGPFYEEGHSNRYLRRKGPAR